MNMVNNNKYIKNKILSKGTLTILKNEMIYQMSGSRIATGISGLIFACLMFILSLFFIKNSRHVPQDQYNYSATVVFIVLFTTSAFYMCWPRLRFFKDERLTVEKNKIMYLFYSKNQISIIKLFCDVFSLFILCMISLIIGLIVFFGKGLKIQTNYIGSNMPNTNFWLIIFITIVAISIIYLFMIFTARLIIYSFRNIKIGDILGILFGLFISLSIVALLTIVRFSIPVTSWISQHRILFFVIPGLNIYSPICVQYLTPGQFPLIIVTILEYGVFICIFWKYFAKKQKKALCVVG